MTLKEFAQMLDGREYGCEITQDEEKLAKELGFVVVFGYSDDNAEFRGAIDDEIGCYDGGVLEHKDLPSTIYANWCPEDIDCAWAYGTSIPHEKFHIYDHGELYCVGIVCDINKPKQTHADRIRDMSDEELAIFLECFGCCHYCSEHERLSDNRWYSDERCDEKCAEHCLEWLKQPVEADNG